MLMIHSALSILFGIIVVTTPLPRDQRQYGFFSPFNQPGFIFPDPNYNYNAANLGARIQENTNDRFVMDRIAIINRIQQQIEDSRINFPKPISPIEAGFDKPTKTSSVTKVVNGQRVTVNETLYSNSKGNKSGNSHVFRIKTVDIVPHNEDSTESKEENVSEEHSHESREELEETSDEAIDDSDEIETAGETINDSDI